MKNLSEKLSDFPLRKALYDRFGEKLSNETNQYSISEDDLKDIYQIVNDVIFDSKLISKIEINIVDRTDEMAKGVIGFKTNNLTHKTVPLIKIIREIEFDSMVSMINVICHEMIHEYDMLYGPISKMKNWAISVVNGKQMIGDYDAHGSYFQSWMKRIVDAGMPVSIYQPDKVRLRYFTKEDFMDENEKPTMNSHNQEQRKYNNLCDRTKMFFDAVKSDDLFVVEVHKDYTYILMA